MDNEFQSYTFECSVDSEIVVTCFDNFCKKLKKKTVVVIDNAPIHLSEEFEENIPKWESKNLFIKYLPAYSPELNLIEILWRFIKYHWLPFSAYSSFQTLVENVEEILKQVGEKYEICFN